MNDMFDFTCVLLPFWWGCLRCCWEGRGVRVGFWVLWCVRFVGMNVRRLSRDQAASCLKHGLAKGMGIGRVADCGRILAVALVAFLYPTRITCA